MEDKKPTANAGPLPGDTPLDRMIKELPLPIPLTSKPILTTIPRTEEQADQFIGSHFDCKRQDPETGEITYQLTSHDLISAFSTYFAESHSAVEPIRWLRIIKLDGQTVNETVDYAQAPASAMEQLLKYYDVEEHPLFTLPPDAQGIRDQYAQLCQRVAELEDESRTRHEWGMTILGGKLELEKQVAELRECLESAKNGLQWYQDNNPEAVSEADYEMVERIEAVLKGGAS